MTKRAKDTFFYGKTFINCKGRLIDLSTPHVMGILNVTPDSFYDGGKYRDLKDAVEHGLQMKAEEATFIDIGGCSTRPGSEYPGKEEEIDRVIPVIKALVEKDPEVIISIDTYHPEVAEKAIQSGAAIINDISAGSIFPEMIETVARLKVPYILMHMQGTPTTMQDDPKYNDVVQEVLYWFSQKIARLKELGVNDIIIDPGFGFGKTVEDNYRLLNHLNDFKITGLPMLVGFSRKRMVNRVLGTNPASGLAGTIALNTLALGSGANILRVHDVKEAVEVIKIHTFARSIPSHTG